VLEVDREEGVVDIIPKCSARHFFSYNMSVRVVRRLIKKEKREGVEKKLSLKSAAERTYVDRVASSGFL